MRHIFDPSHGFHLERDLGLDREPTNVESSDEPPPEIQRDVDNELAENGAIEIEPDFKPELEPLENASQTSPQLLARFLDLWALRGHPSDERLLQAKALLYCALPYHRTHERAISRAIHLGRTRRVTITLKATDDEVELPLRLGSRSSRVAPNPRLRIRRRRAQDPRRVLPSVPSPPRRQRVPSVSSGAPPTRRAGPRARTDARR